MVPGRQEQFTAPLSGFFSTVAGAPDNNGHEVSAANDALRPMDPRDPYGSAIRGPHQITAIADTCHSDDTIVRDIARHMPAIARAGVRHLLVEFPLRSIDEIQGLCPGIDAGGTLVEKLSIAEGLKRDYYAFILAETAPRAEATGQSLADAERALLLETREEFDRIAVAEDTLRTHEFIERLNDPQASISHDEMASYAYLFASQYDDDQGSGHAYIDLFLKAREHGVKIHYTGDRRGFEYAPMLDAANAELDALLSGNADIVPIDKSLGAIRDPREWEATFDGLDPATRDRLTGFWNRRGDLLDRIEEIDAQRAGARMSPEAERERAQRFLECAQGEKALAFWGRLHFTGENGINVQIDRLLGVDASANPATRTVVMSVYPSEKFHRNQVVPAASREAHLRRFVAEDKTVVTRAGQAVFSEELQLETAPTFRRPVMAPVEPAFALPA